MAKKNDVIDTGLVEFALPFDRGEEKIYFNPNDTEFYIRISDMINEISSLYDTMSSKYENATAAMDKLHIVRELNESVKAAFDVAFGNEVSNVIFKYVSPNGIVRSRQQYFAFYILEWLMPKIEAEAGKAFTEANQALAKAINKHTEKYNHKFK